MAYSKTYEKMLKEVQVKITVDTTNCPWVGTYTGFTDIENGVVTNLTLTAGADIGGCDVMFLRKKFGDHFQGHIPVSVSIGAGVTKKILLRGFLITESASISSDGQTMTCKVADYKWFLSKCTKIRGRYWATGSVLPNMFGSPSSAGVAKLQHEVFQGKLSLGDADTVFNNGYLQSEACVFNEDGQPDCSSDNNYAKDSVFKKRAMVIENGAQKIYKANYGASYWTHKSILAYILEYFTKPYMSDKIDVTSNSRSQLDRLGTTDRVPFNLSIEGMSPLEAIDAVVKTLPGRWIWWLSYTDSDVLINIKDLDNASSTAAAKQIFLAPDNMKGTKQLENSKLATLPTMYPFAESIVASRDYSETVKTIILKGGGIKLTTTLELQQVQPLTKYTIDNQDIYVPFATADDFSKWKLYVMAKKNDVKFNKDYESPYRYYCVPVEGSLLRASLGCINYVDAPQVTNTNLRALYGAVQLEYKKMLAKSLKIDRKFDKPCHPEFDKPIVFAYDEYLKYDAGNKYLVDADRSIVIYDSDDYNFDATSGLVVFDKPQHMRPYHLSSGEKDKKDDDLRLPEAINSVESSSEKTVETGGIAGKLILKSRRIFCTLSLTLDLPSMAADDIPGTVVPVQSELPQYDELSDNDLIVHVNAFYPSLPGHVVKFKENKPAAFTMTTAGGGTISVSEFVAKNILYPCDALADYKMYPQDGENVILSKLNTLLKSKQWYKESIDVSLGCFDTTYNVGDMITAIANSVTKDDRGVDIQNSGYYGLKDYVMSVTHNLDGARKSRSTRLSISNDVRFTIGDFEKTMLDVVKNPSIFGPRKEANNFIEIKEDTATT